MPGIRYFSYSEIERFFESEKIHENATTGDIFVASIADLLFLIERYQKNHIKLSEALMMSRFSKLIELGVIFFPEIDGKCLLENLFESDDDAETHLWVKACNKIISPRFSISLVAMKVNQSSFWGTDVFDQMESYYLQFEPNA